MSRPAAAVNRVIKAYDVRGLVGEEIDERSSPTSVGRSHGWCATSGPATVSQVVIGYDMRSSSPSLAAAFAEGVAAQGLDVTRIGLASTDQLYFASGLLDCPGAMFTASHNPAAYNGIKLCRAGAKPVGKDTGLSTISDEVIDGVPAYDGPRGRDRATATCSTTTASSCARSSTSPGCGRCGWPSTRATAWAATPRLRCSVRIPSITLLPLYFELDGTFPNHEANPLDPANLVDLQAHVRRNRRRHRAGLRRRRRPLLRRRRTRPARVAVGGDRPGRRRVNSAARSAPPSSTT